LQQTVHLSAATGPLSAKQTTTYAITFRGNTVVDITPRDNSPMAYPLYLRDAMKADKASMKTIERYATTKIAPW
jgi:hypothetical protein